MKTKTSVFGLILAATSSTSFAATINVDREIDLSGGVTGGTYFTQHPGFGGRSLNTQLNDFIIEVKNANKKEKLGFTAGLGVLAPVTLTSTTPPTQGTPTTTGIQYGWFDYTSGKLKLELGHLETKVGYESSVGYKNPHITRGALWASQPTYYPGIRMGSESSGLSFYLDLTNAGPNRQAAAIGASGKADKLEWAANYYDEKLGNNIIDITIQLPINELRFGLNVNRIWVDADPGPGVDDDALGVAAFGKLKSGDIDIPVRAEFVDDGTSGLYGGVDNALSFTISPTKWLDKATYLRGELAFISTKNKIFSDDDGNPKDSQATLAVEAGLLF